MLASVHYHHMVFTYDWIADKALGLLLVDEKAWLIPHKIMYLLGTKAPDNDKFLLNVMH